MVRKHLHGGAVLAAVGHDDVRVPLTGLHKGLVHGFDRGEVLVDDAVQRAAPLFDVPQDAAEDALIGVGIHINFVVEQLAQLRLHKGQDALHDEDGGGLDVLYLVAAVVVGVIVHRAVDGAACFQLLQVVDQQGVIKGVRVVVVQFAALLKRQLVVALVIAVVGDEADFILPKPLFQPQGQRGLAAAGPAGNADDQIFHTPISSCALIPVEKSAEIRYTIC